jgi:hypothetical protein
MTANDTKQRALAEEPQAPAEPESASSRRASARKPASPAQIASARKRPAPARRAAGDAATPSAPKRPASARRRQAAAAHEAGQPSREQIAERAYFIHRAEPDSHDLDNWLRAERELAGEPAGEREAA